MRPYQTFQPTWMQHLKAPIQPQSVPSGVVHRVLAAMPSLLLGVTVWWGGGLSAQAEGPETAPPELTQTLAQIDAAANSHNVEAVLQFYGQNFRHSDGLTRQTLQRALSQLWQQYPRLNYQTELRSWEATNGGITAETVTRITGIQQREDRDLMLSATIESRQRYEGQKIVEQEILAERSELTAGTTPPKVEVRLPEQVNVGQEFVFDAVVQEPLGERLLLGAAVEEPIRGSNYFNPASFNLQLLSAGGIFRVGQAPAIADDRWISAVLVREDGITAVTQRLNVTGQNRTNRTPQPRQR